MSAAQPSSIPPAPGDVRARVFVSSTWIDLQRERQAVEAVLHRMRALEFSGMEHFGSRRASAQQASLDEVDRADVYVGVFGRRYGSGITEDEYRRARAREIPCFLYFAAGPPPDGEPEDPRMARLRAELTDPHTGLLASEFTGPDELAAIVAADLHTWLFDTVVVPALTRASREGRFREVRRVVGQVLDEGALRGSLARSGVSAGDDLLDALLAVGGPGPVAQPLVDGIRELRTDYAARIRNYLAEYLGTPDQPVPFGGRDAALRELDGWLSDAAAPPYLLLAAEAGRGKSALLVHWARRLLAAEGVTVVFVPVSIRFRTNLASVVFAALAARLAAVHGEEVRTDAGGTSVEVWRGLVAEYLGRPAPAGTRLVVLLDGLDEAADWKAGEDLFPRQPGAGVRLVVAARTTAEAPDENAWRGLLGWDGRRARAFRLPPLDARGIASVLTGMGFPLDALGRDTDVVAELHRLSGGDPLLVRLYADDLWARGEAAARLRPEDLAAIQPGLEGWFDRWWREQRELWGGDAPLRERSVQTLLDVLTMAQGPLDQQDLLALAPPDAGLNRWTLDDALAPVSRIVTGDGRRSGCVFSHPRFSMYLRARMPAAEQVAWEGRFVAWGRGVLRDLAEGRLAPADVPPYLLQYHGAHLERAGEGPDAFRELVSEGWMRAWEASPGGYSGFATDVARAWRAFSAANAAAAERGLPLPHLPDEIRCALLATSIQSLAANIPPALLERAVAQGVWPPAQAVAYARQKPDAGERADALRRLAPLLPDQRATLEHEALEAALLMRDSFSRALALLALVESAVEPPLEELRAAIHADDLVSYAQANLLSQAALVLAERDRPDAALEWLEHSGLVYSWDPVLRELAWRWCARGLPEYALQAAARREAGAMAADLRAALAVQAAAAGRLHDVEAYGIAGFFGFNGSHRLLQVAIELGSRDPAPALTSADEPWILALVKSPPHELEPATLNRLLEYAGQRIAAASRQSLASSLEAAPVYAVDSMLLARLRWVRLCDPTDRDPHVRRTLETIAHLDGTNFVEVFTACLDLLSQGTVLPALAAFRRLAREHRTRVARPLAEALDRLGRCDLVPGIVQLEAWDTLLLAAVQPWLPEADRERLVGRMINGLRRDVLGELSVPEALFDAPIPERALRDALDRTGRIGDQLFQILAHTSLDAAVVKTGEGEREAELRSRITAFCRGLRLDEAHALAIIAFMASGSLRDLLLQVLTEALRREMTNRSLWLTDRPLWSTERPLWSKEPLWSTDRRLLSSVAMLLQRLPRNEANAYVLKLCQAAAEVGDGVLLEVLGQIGHLLPDEVVAELPIGRLLGSLWTHIGYDWVQVRSQLARLAPSEQRATLKAEVISSARLDGNPEQIWPLLEHLDRAEVQNLLSRWLVQGTWRSAARVIAALAPYLAGPDLQRAWTRAETFVSPEGRALALAGLLPYLQPDDATAVLDALFSPSMLKLWAGVLSREAMQPEIGNPTQATALFQCVRAALDDDRVERLAAATEGEPDNRSVFLHWLLQDAGQMEGAAVCRVIQSALRGVPAGSISARARLLADVAGLAPALAVAGAPGDLARIREAIDDVARLFP